MEIRKRLTRKQASLVKAFVDPNVSTIAEAGRKAGYADRKGAWRCLQMPTVQDALKEFHDKLLKGGVDDEVLVKVIKDGLKATETVRASLNGEFMDERTVPDYSVRHKYLDTVVKIRGFVRADKEPVKNTQVNIYNFRDEKTEDLLRSLDEIISERMRSKSIEAQSIVPRV